MSIFLNYENCDFINRAPVRRLFAELTGAIEEQAALMLPEQHQELLEGIVSELENERAREIEYAQIISDALDRLEKSDSPSDLENQFEECRKIFIENFNRRGSVLSMHYFCTRSRDLAVKSAIRICEAELLETGLEKDKTPHVWCGIGGYGRGEATLTTPCDLILILNDKPINPLWFERLAKAVTAQLSHLRIASQTGMSPAFESRRGTIEEWSAKLEGQVVDGVDTGDMIMFSDIRAIYGSEKIAGKFRSTLYKKLLTDHAMIQSTLKNAASFSHGLDFFGRLKTEKSIEHWGQFDLVRFALVPLVHLIRAIAVSGSFNATSTADRIKLLYRADKLQFDIADNLLKGYHVFTKCKIELEIEETGNEYEGFFVNTNELPEDIGSRFKESMEALFNLQRRVFQTA